MKKFTKVLEKKDSIETKVSNLKEKLNKVKDLNAEIEHEESGKTVLMKIKLNFDKNLKKLTPESLSTILNMIGGYIEGIEYEKNQMLLKIKTFDHLLND